MSNPINVIDLFAGPGGLGEGFSAFDASADGFRPFKIRMSVEKEASAHKTLTLRALYRSLEDEVSKTTYKEYLAGNIQKRDLINSLPEEWEHALQETLSKPTALGEDNERIHGRLRELKRKHKGEPWVVIGGPPCQAYSLAGRSRNKGIKNYSPEDDHRHFLYKEYLQVLHEIQPEIFVMENVKGILTSKVGGERIFPAILSDLKNPTKALGFKKTSSKKEYRIYSFVTGQSGTDLFDPVYESDKDYIIKSEDFGIPQARHRVILLGVCTDIQKTPITLNKDTEVPVHHALTGLPQLRSKLSKKIDTPENWEKEIWSQINRIRKEIHGNEAKDFKKFMDDKAYALRSEKPTSSMTYNNIKEKASKKLPKDLKTWLIKDSPDFVLNHETRGHISGDLGRYFFSACWAAFYNGKKGSPKSADFPPCLAPAHANWKSGKFADRFRVQIKNKPATTITSHISKDGHYFIHFDPTQCRSLTVREAARIQTFPDNYFFEGNRTEQYVQVGNAVPPYLAVQLAKVAYEILR